MGRPRKYWPVVEASRDEASLAVRLYNDPAEVRAFEGFVVHMHVAWLYLLHAEFSRDNVDYRHRQRDNPRRLEKVDGEPKYWGLARSAKERWHDEKHAVRANLAFFIGLRNKVEHRYVREQQALSAAVSGQAQALLLNYEQELTDQFGAASSLSTRLRFPVFVGSFTSEGEKALLELRRRLPASLRTFIAEYHANLDPSVSDDPRYELRLRVVQELAPKDPNAMAIQYTKYEDLTEEQRETVEAIGKKGLVVTKERQRRVVNYGLMRPSEVIKAVQAEISFPFGMGAFVEAWQKLKVRPRGGAEHPEVTDEKYCLYDSRHKDYAYTPAYVKKLVRELSSEESYP